MTKRIIIVAVLLALGVFLHLNQYEWGTFDRDPNIRLVTVEEGVPNEVEPTYFGLQPYGGQIHRGYVLGLFLPVCFFGTAFFMAGLRRTNHGALSLTPFGYAMLGVTGVAAAAAVAVAA